MPVLAIDTSTTRGSVAVLDAGRVVFSETFFADRTHSVDLFTILDCVMKLTPHCERIVIGLGPGSYSGIRIAISAAIGLGFGLKARLLGIPSIVAIEAGDLEYLTIGDARRGTFYFAHIRNGECVEGPALLTPEKLRGKLALNEKLPVFASALMADFPEAQIVFPSAEKLARLAEEGRGISATDILEPIYLRPPHITTPKN